MAFSADELRVLRRALAEALLTAPHTESARAAGDVQDYLRLAEALAEAEREGGRLRSFLLADLARYRAALPGTAGDYLRRLTEALGAGYLPVPEDLAALRDLLRLPCSPAESRRRDVIRRRCEDLAEQAVRARLEGRRPPTRPQLADRARLLALPGGRRPTLPRPAEPVRAAEPARPDPEPRPPRRVPTPAEIWPPRRRESPPEAPGRRAPSRRATG